MGLCVSSTGCPGVRAARGEGFGASSSTRENSPLTFFRIHENDFCDIPRGKRLMHTECTKVVCSARVLACIRGPKMVVGWVHPREQDGTTRPEFIHHTPRSCWRSLPPASPRTEPTIRPIHTRGKAPSIQPARDRPRRFIIYSCSVARARKTYSKCP